MAAAAAPQPALLPAARPAAGGPDRLSELVVETAYARQRAADRPARHAAAPAAASAAPRTAPPTRPPAAKRPPGSHRAAAAAPSRSSLAAAVVAWARRQVGKPYRFAAAGPDAYDCSGLAKAAYAQVGISIPHQTGGIIKLGRSVPRSQLVPGDLVFPSSGHVGIYIGGGQMIHAPQPGDHVRVAEVYAYYAARRLLTV